MPTTAVTDLLRQLIQGILRDPAKAEAYSQNPAEYLAAHGVTDHDLSDVDIRSLVVESAAECSLPEPVQKRIDDYGKGELRETPASAAAAPPPPPDAMAPATPKSAPAVSPPPADPPAGASPAEIIQHHISYATYVTYESNTHIVQNLVDNSTNIDNRSNVSVDVNGNVYGDIDLSNEVSNATATGDGAMAVGRDMVNSNANTGSGDVNQVGTINAQDSAVAVGGNATNIQDRSSTDNSTSISDSYNDNSTTTDNSTNVDVRDSFNDNSDNSTDNSTNIDVDVRDSFNDNSDNSTDNSTNIDVDLGGGRSSDDPGFGEGSDTGRDETPGGRDTGSVDEPYTRDGTQEQIDEKYGPEGNGGLETVPMQTIGEPIVPMGAGMTREPSSEMPTDETNMMD